MHKHLNMCKVTQPPSVKPKPEKPIVPQEEPHRRVADWLDYNLALHEGRGCILKDPVMQITYQGKEVTLNENKCLCLLTLYGAKSI